MTSSTSFEERFPVAWKSCPIGQAGYTILGQQKNSSNVDGQILPYLRPANVRDGMLDLTDLATMPFPEPDRYVLRPADILLCEGLGSKHLVGRAAAYNGHPAPLLFQNTLIRFRPRPGIDPAYALLVMRVYQKTGVFASAARGIGIAHIGLARFRNIPFPLPPTTVQGEIALAAQSIQDNLDLIRDAVQSSLAELEGVVRKARDNLILGNSHSPSWERGETGTAQWPLQPAAEVVDYNNPIVYGIVQPGPDVAHGVPYIRGQDLQEGYILQDHLRKTSHEISERYARSRLRPGDVLLGIIRHTRVAIVPTELDGANITQGTARFRPGEECDSAFLSHWLSSAAAQAWLRTRMRGIDMPGLNLRDVRQLPVPMPPLPEQKRIGRELDGIARRARELYEAFTKLLDALPNLESRLLESFAYGPHATAISHQTSGEAERLLSEQLLNSLRFSDEAEDLTENAEEALPQDADPTGSSSEPPLAGADIRPPKPIGHATETNPSSISEALSRLNGEVAPEVLFAELRLSESAVDSFYSVLRDLVSDSVIEIIRPDNTNVLLRLRAEP